MTTSKRKNLKPQTWHDCTHLSRFILKLTGAILSVTGDVHINNKQERRSEQGKVGQLPYHDFWLMHLDARVFYEKFEWSYVKNELRVRKLYLFQ
jgi:hypothetical protein